MVAFNALLFFIRVYNKKSYIDWAEADLNRRHMDFQSTALPTELPARFDSRSTGLFLSRTPLPIVQVETGIIISLRG